MTAAAAGAARARESVETLMTLIPGVTPEQAAATATAIRNTGRRLGVPASDVQNALDALFSEARS